jgi:hypothetical protein
MFRSDSSLLGLNRLASLVIGKVRCVPCHISSRHPPFSYNDCRYQAVCGLIRVGKSRRLAAA